MIPNALAVALVGLATIYVAAVLLWLVSLRIDDTSIVDPFWGPGFAVVTTAYYLTHGGFDARGTLVLVLVGVWAARLGIHLLVRNRREGEDPRYREMAEPHGESWWWVSLFKVFLLQATLLWLISAPLLAAVLSTAPLGILDALGTVVFLAGLGFEAVADHQLVRFKSDPDNEGEVLDSGLWRYSRHPNYFGDALLWWGYWLVAVGGGAWWSFFGPAIMTFLLLKVSGVTLLERGIEERRPAYADYIERTSAFFPWPPRK